MRQIVFVIVFVFAVGFSAHSQPARGTQVPEIILPNAAGHKVPLSSLKGKVVLIDFWASWCGPCRASNKELRPLYNNYKDKGFEIYQVSIDDDKRDWLNAVNRDKINWTSLVDTSAAYGNALTKTWNIVMIPSSFLIDKQGTLVAINPPAKELPALLDKLL